MKSNDDFPESLADEVLTEMAHNFFGERVQLEDNIRFLHKTADRLRQKEAGIYERAGFLNHLMVTPEAARSLYRAIGIDSGFFDVKTEVTDRVLPALPPLALTRKGEYVKFVLWAYEALRGACENYLKGSASINPNRTESEAHEADYRLVQSLCILINQEIDRINQRCLPTQVLQAVKRFDPATQSKEYITGGGTEYVDHCSLNENLAFKPIDFSTLNLRALPELPPLEKVQSTISREAKTNYERHSARIHDMLTQIKRRCRLSQQG